MKPNMRRNLPGIFATRDLAQGAWCFSRSEPSPIEVFVRGADFRAAETLRPSAVRDVDVEWRGGAVVLTLTSAGRRHSMSVQSVIVHEPLARLYQALPLVRFDDKARRFWRMVFRLVRIPGGRLLLGILARRTRGGR